MCWKLLKYPFKSKKTFDSNTDLMRNASFLRVHSSSSFSSTPLLLLPPCLFILPLVFSLLLSSHLSVRSSLTTQNTTSVEVLEPSRPSRSLRYTEPGNRRAEFHQHQPIVGGGECHRARTSFCEISRTWNVPEAKEHKLIPSEVPKPPLDFSTVPYLCASDVYVCNT